MKRCAMCGYEKDVVSMVQVAPATWCGFQNYVDICEECQASDKYQKMIKQKKIIVPKEQRAKASAAVKQAEEEA